MEEYDLVILNKDFEDLKKGTKGTIVLKYNDENYEVEFFDKNMDTIDVYTINISYLDKRYKDKWVDYLLSLYNCSSHFKNSKQLWKYAINYYNS